MKSDILFLAPFPTKDNIKDGMISRIHVIDGLFEDSSRIYLNVRLFKYWKMKMMKKDNVTVYQLNSFFHILLILKIVFSTKRIYTHSIWGCLGIFYALPFLSTCIILDAHGVVPEEILLYTSKKYLGHILNVIERLVFSKCLCVICVTKSMQKHFMCKYPHYKGRYVVYSIYPPSLLEDINMELLQQYRWNQKKVCVIYSGGVSPWQNIELMLDSIKKTLNTQAEYIFLVSNSDYVIKLMNDKGLKSSNIQVLSVMPNELGEYYQKADYAFVLRDDNVVNRVANPTKIVEYLAFGIVPIVLSPYIGDYLERNYEYISLSDFIGNKLKKPQKPSLINIGIAKELFEENKQADLFNFILDSWNTCS